jgi:hypothetical protein
VKKAVVFIGFAFLVVSQTYGQHEVNDVRKYNGWYKLNIEADAGGNSRYIITQCYPNGDEYVLSDAERKRLPLWIKVFCIGIYEEGLKGQMDQMTFSENGISMRIMGFTLMIDSERTDEEILEALGQTMVNRYKGSDW